MTIWWRRYPLEHGGILFQSLFLWVADLPGRRSISGKMR